MTFLLFIPYVLKIIIKNKDTLGSFSGHGIGEGGQ